MITVDNKQEGQSFNCMNVDQRLAEVHIMSESFVSSRYEAQAYIQEVQ